jgi:hypothetical protein
VFSLGLLMILFTKQEKRLGDLVAGTIVIQEAQNSNQEIEIDPAAQELADTLAETGRIEALTPDVFATVRRYLQRYPTLSPAARLTVGKNLHQELLAITKLYPKTEKPNCHLFIQAIYLICLQQFGG